MKTPKPRQRSSNDSAEFTFSSELPYANKDEYIEKDLSFTLKAIEFQAGKGFEKQDRWALTVEPDDGRGEELLTFGSNEKRDAVLKSAQAFIKQQGPIHGVRLRKSGNAYYLHNSGHPKAS